MLQLITENAQAGGSSRDGKATAHRLLGSANQALCCPTSIVLRGQFMEVRGTSLHSSCHDGLGTGIALQQRQGCRSTGINEDLREFRKEHHEQGMDLGFVASGFVTQLGLQAHYLSIRGDYLSGDVACSGFPAEKDTRY